MTDTIPRPSSSSSTAVKATGDDVSKPHPPKEGLSQDDVVTSEVTSSTSSNSMDVDVFQPNAVKLPSEEKMGESPKDDDAMDAGEKEDNAPPPPPTTTQSNSHNNSSSAGVVESVVMVNAPSTEEKKEDVAMGEAKALPSGSGSNNKVAVAEVKTTVSDTTEDALAAEKLGDKLDRALDALQEVRIFMSTLSFLRM